MAIGSTIIQTPANVSRIANFFVAANGQALNCSTSSASVALVALADGSPATDIVMFNSGSVNVFVAFGSTAPTAAIPADGTPANGIIIAPGAYLTFCKGSNLFLAAITASSTATIYFYQGYGS